MVTPKEDWDACMKRMDEGEYEKEKEAELEKKKVLGICKFNKATEVFAGKDSLIYQHEITRWEEETYFIGKAYSIYKVHVGAGNKPKFIYCKPSEKIENGEQSLYLKPISCADVQIIIEGLKDKGTLVDFVNKQARIKVAKDSTLEDYENALINTHNKTPIFFEKTLPIPKAELTKIKDYYKFAVESLSQGVEIDSNLVDCYVAQIPEVNPELISPKIFMESADHPVLLTNAGTGKTSLAVGVTQEPTIVDCSSANLIGFATADSKVSGKLDKRTKSTVIEEIQEFKESETLGQLLTYMEQGETERAKGQGIKCRGHSQIIFQGNPKVKLEQDTTMTQFLMAKAVRDFLQKITSNTEAFSRRIGDLEIGTKYKTVEGKGINEYQREKTVQILRTISEGFKDDFAYFLKDEKVFEWLKQKHDEEYIKKIEGLRDKCGDTLLKEFFKGQKINHRHLRGGAIRRAWLQMGISKALSDSFEEKDIDEILECAEAHYERRKGRTLRSLANILSIFGTPEYKRLIEMDIKTIKPEYAKLMICSFLRYKTRNESELIVSINEFQNDFNHLRDAWNVEGKYTSFSRIKEPFEEHLTQFRNLLENFGLDYDKSISSFIIKDLETFNKKLEAYRDILEGTKGTEGTESTKGTKGTGEEGTEGTENKNNLCVTVPIVPCTYDFKEKLSEQELRKEGLDDDSIEMYRKEGLVK